MFSRCCASPIVNERRKRGVAWSHKKDKWWSVESSIIWSHERVPIAGNSAQHHPSSLLSLWRSTTHQRKHKHIEQPSCELSYNVEREYTALWVCLSQHNRGRSWRLGNIKRTSTHLQQERLTKRRLSQAYISQHHSTKAFMQEEKNLQHGLRE